MNSASRQFFFIGFVCAGIGVLLGAFAAHGLKQSLTPEMLGVFETGVRYQMYHAFALMFVGWFAQHRQDRLIVIAGWLFLLGIIFFSGSLYVLSIFSLPGIGVITPLGGVAFTVGWGSLAVTFFETKK